MLLNHLIQGIIQGQYFTEALCRNHGLDIPRPFTNNTCTCSKQCRLPGTTRIAWIIAVALQTKDASATTHTIFCVNAYNQFFVARKLMASVRKLLASLSIQSERSRSIQSVVATQNHARESSMWPRGCCNSLWHLHPTNKQRFYNLFVMSK